MLWSKIAGFMTSTLSKRVQDILFINRQKALIKVDTTDQASKMNHATTSFSICRFDPHFGSHTSKPLKYRLQGFNREMLDNGRRLKSAHILMPREKHSRIVMLMVAVRSRSKRESKPSQTSGVSTVSTFKGSQQ